MNKPKYRFCFQTNSIIPDNSLNEEHFPSDIVRNKKEPLQIKEILNNGSKVRILTSTGVAHTNFDNFFEKFIGDFFSLNITESDNIKIMQMFKELVLEQKKLFDCLSQSEEHPHSRILEQTTEYICNKFMKMDTIYKQKKARKQNPLFVEPIEKPIGLTWKTKIDPISGIPDHTYQQPTFHYVPIMKTLTSLFSQEQFKEMYMNYNYKEKHVCKPGIFKDFCCGSIYKQQEIYDDPGTIQLIIGVDDFETCCALKSKAGKHKVNATYFQIRNIPEELRSKLDHIYLISLCETINFDSKDVNYDHIARLIVDEVKILETDGVPAGDRKLKGTISTFGCDNLAANQIYGFTESFSCHYYCRRCEKPRTDCQKLVKEDKKMLRSLASYNKNVIDAEMQTEIDFSITKGVKKKCIFNELKYFHTINNVCIDVMHDINEGCIPVCLKNFFEHCISNKLMGLSEIQRRIRDFNYSPAYKKYTPSLINIKKGNLNQNAMQNYCLIIHLPFILYDVKEKLKDIWKPIETLLKCITTIYSTEICDSDLKTFEKNCSEHLKSMINILGVQLTPKEHTLTHYANYVKSMGPPILAWTMRFECKHKTMTSTARKVGNFKNITKTMSYEHQKAMCKPSECGVKIFQSRDSVLFSNSAYFDLYEDIVTNNPEIAGRVCHVLKFAKHEAMLFRTEKLVIFEKELLEIEVVLKIEKEIWFVCSSNSVMGYESFNNSIKVEKNDGIKLIKLEKLDSKKSYDKIFTNNKFYVICENLDIRNVLK